MKDVDGFLEEKKGAARVSGYVDAPHLGGRLKISAGKLSYQSKELDDQQGQISFHYQLDLESEAGEHFKLSAFKCIEHGPEKLSWSDISTYYFSIHQVGTKGAKPTGAIGILEMKPKELAKQFSTYRTSGPSHWLRSNAVCRFNELLYRRFGEKLQKQLHQSEPEMWQRHRIPCNSNEGVRNAKHEVYPFSTEDGLGLTLNRFYRKESKDIIFLMHGLTTSTDMFIMPEHYNVVQFFIDQGYEVWSLDWRGSRRFPYNLQVHRYSIDHVGLYDVPAALKTIRLTAGPNVAIHAVAHCVGGIALTTAMAAGKAVGLKSIIINSASLTPTVHPMSKAKIFFAPDVLEYLLRFNYISPDFAHYSNWTPGKLLSRFVSLAHDECDDPSCHMVSFMWGWGSPAAFVHRNISSTTHDRLSDLFGGTTVHYYRHIRKMIMAGEAVPYEAHPDLPMNYLSTLGAMKLPPIFLCSGSENKIFPGSNLQSYKKLKSISPSAPISYKEFQGYGHQDIFIGRAAHQDIFPSFLKFIRDNSDT